MRTSGQESPKRKALKIVCGISGALSIIVLLLTFAIQIPTFSMWFYEFEYNKNGTYEQVKMEKEDLLYVTRHMLRYMHGETENLNVRTTVDGEKRYFFSEIEIYHMQDVERLFSIGFVVQTVMVLFFVVPAILFISPVLEKKIEFFLKALRNAGIAAVSVIVFTAVAVAVDFDSAFTIFHEIFFDNDMWILDPDVDLLVNIVPEQFFIDISILIAVIYVVFLVLLIVLSDAGIKYYRKNKHKFWR